MKYTYTYVFIKYTIKLALLPHSFFDVCQMWTAKRPQHRHRSLVRRPLRCRPAVVAPMAPIGHPPWAAVSVATAAVATTVALAAASTVAGTSFSYEMW